MEVILILIAIGVINILFYFVSTKEREQIIEELLDAIKKLEDKIDGKS